MSTTIYDVAEEAGVSTATVSRVLNSEASVAEQTRRDVRAAAKATGYQPHASAQNLARQRTDQVAVVAPVVANYFYLHVLRGIQNALTGRELDLVIHAPSNPQGLIHGDGAMPARVRDGDGEARDRALTERLERAVQPGRSDGILLLSVPLPDRFANQLLDSRQSVVLVDIKHPKFESFTVDNRYGGRAATQHLITLGYERIGHITVQYDPPPARQRREGYEAALREAGRSVDETLIATSNERPFAFSETGGYSAMKQLLEREPGPDAVFAASDMQALGAIRAVRQAGLRVPEDVAIVGFDDVELSLSAGLTTVRQPAQEMGRRAAETLLRRLKDGGGDVESGAPSAARNGSTRLPVSSTVFSPELIVRSSCGAQEE